MASPKPRRQITFPDGDWIDYWDNRIEHRGGETIEADVPEDHSPLYVRRGSIIPLDVVNNAVDHGSDASKGWRTLDIYPAKETSEQIIWDTAIYPPQAFRDRSVVSLSPLDNGIDVSIAGGPKRDTILRMLWSKSPASVIVQGNAIRKFETVGDWEQSQRGWYYDATDQRLWVRVDAFKDTTVTIAD